MEFGSRNFIVIDLEYILFFFFRELSGAKWPKKKIKDTQICDEKNREIKFV